MSLPPIASLSMYDWPEVENATNAFWREIRDGLRGEGIDAPDELEREEAAEDLWFEPSLVFAQTCGYPFATQLAGKVRYVATPHYNVEGCDAALYSSAIIVRKDAAHHWPENKDALRIAVNSSDSLSGYRALKTDFSPDLEGRDLLVTQGHRNSIEALAKGKADLAAVDAVCWHFARSFDPKWCSFLEVAAWTQLRPSLPFITSVKRSETDVARMRQVLGNVFSKPSTVPALKRLRLSGIEVIDADNYAPLAKL